MWTDDKKQHYTEAISHLRAARAHAEAADAAAATNLIDGALRMLRSCRDDHAAKVRLPAATLRSDPGGIRGGVLPD